MWNWSSELVGTRRSKSHGGGGESQRGAEERAQHVVQGEAQLLDSRRRSRRHPAGWAVVAMRGDSLRTWVCRAAPAWRPVGMAALYMGVDVHGWQRPRLPFVVQMRHAGCAVGVSQEEANSLC